MQQNTPDTYPLLWVGTIGAFALTLVLQTMFDDGSIVASVTVTLVNAILTLGILYLCTKKNPFSHSGEPMGVRFSVLCAVIVCCAGLAQGIPAWITCCTDASTQASANNIQFVSLVVGLCLLTGVYEEGLFRGLLLPSLLHHFDSSRQPLLLACLISSVLFALLHVGWNAAMPADVSSGVLFVLKPVQAFVFSWCMTYISVGRSNRLGLCMAAHGMFDVLALSPVMVSSGMVAQTYALGGWSDVLAVATSVVVLALAAVALTRGTIGKFDEK